VKPMAIALAMALLTAILIAWEPRFWREAIPITAITLVACASLVEQAFSPAHFSLRGTRISLCLVILIALWGPAQLLLHQTQVPWLTIQRSVEWAMGAVCFILAAQILKERPNRNIFLNLQLWAITALAVAAMLQKYLTPGKLFGLIPVGDNVVGTLYYKNQFAALMELAAPIALWKVSRGQLVGGGLAFAAMFAATITSESRMGVILVLAELLVFLAIMVIQRRMPLRTAVSGAAILALLVAAGAMVAGTEKILTRLEEPNAYVMRRKLLDSTLRMIPAHRWVGSGLGTWPSDYPAFATYDDTTFVNEAHNDWAQWTSEGGIPFALLLAALTLWLAGPSFQSIWGLGLMSVMIHSFVDYPLRDLSIAFLWFAFAGALTGLESRPSDSKTQPI